MARQFTQMPPEVELVIARMRAAEQVLSDPVLESRWWGRLRRNPAERPRDVPTVLKVNYRWNRPAVAGSST
jgi:hypothetical protein